MVTDFSVKHYLYAHVQTYKRVNPNTLLNTIPRSLFCKILVGQDSEEVFISILSNSTTASTNAPHNERNPDGGVNVFSFGVRRRNVVENIYKSIHRSCIHLFVKIGEFIVNTTCVQLAVMNP